MISAIALDDEPLALELLQQYAAEIPHLDLLHLFQKSSEATQFLRENRVDLLFLDIEMPQISGINFLKNLSDPPLVVFTTAHAAFAVDGFDLNATDYLLKPFPFSRFVQAIEKVTDLLAAKKTKHSLLHLRSGYDHLQIPLSDIVVIQASGDYLDYHLQSGRKHTVRMTMKQAAEMLPEKDFVRCHRSFIVSLKYIKKVRNQTIFLTDREVPLSAGYKSSFHAHF